MNTKSFSLQYLHLSDYIVLDLETTGLSPRYDQIIEIAAIKVVNNQIVDKFSTLVKPSTIIPAFITSITGISNLMVKNAPSIDEVILEFYNFIKDDVIIGHNVRFDLNFINCNLADVGLRLNNDYVDTMYLSRQLFPFFSNHKLETLLREFAIANQSVHRALADVYNTNKCYQIIKQEIEKRGLINNYLPTTMQK